MRLGIALAKIKSLHEELPDEDTTEEGKVLQHIFQLRQDFRKTPVRVREVLLNGVPDSRCNPESRLVGNKEFFTAYLLEYRSNDEHQQHCKKLSRHLNDCFQCFEVFSDVVRDYLHNK